MVLTYDRDRALLDTFAESTHGTSPMLVLRHARAHRRAAWSGLDRDRPLATDGRAQARRLVPMLRAYDVDLVLTSDSARCADTVRPYATETGAELRLEGRLSEEEYDSDHLARMVGRLFAGKRAVVVCSHRPVMPTIFGALGIDDPALEPGELLVVHRKSAEVHATERHRP